MEHTPDWQCLAKPISPDAPDPSLTGKSDSGETVSISMRLHFVTACLATITLAFIFTTVVADDYSCSKAKPCSNGACCGVSGYCGYGPTYCGTGCQSNCTATAECGQYASVPGTKCPLNVCCSQYGFCGTTPDFCDVSQKCQSGCGQPSKPSGSGFSASQRVIGYFESWSGTRPCDQWSPSMISASQITHLNFAFALIDGSNHIAPSAPNDVSLYKEAMALKESNPSLKIFISVGGWAFNDPGPSQTRFSTVASSSANRAAFISSCLQFMQTYGFDGVDIDWEYPVDDLRGGVAADKENLNSLVKEFRAAIDSSGRSYGLTLTTPSSYYYLRHFDVAEIAKWIDWFNHMTYDLHGVWDKDSKFLGPNINAHSNLTEIDISMNLFWRNNVPASKIAMGLGFYGRSFQLASSSCTKPGCLFTGPANAGSCTGAAGILSYSEIQSAVNGSSSQKKRAAATVVWDKDAAVKYAYWGDQWVSYDDGDTFKQKIDYANKLGLGGMLIWAIDQDSSKYDAINAVSGTTSIHNTKLAVRAENQRTLRDIDSLTGTCRHTECAKDPKCPSGFSAVATRSKPDKLTAQCKKGQKQLICCPSNNMPQSCRWAGDSPICRNKGFCDFTEQELARDNYGDGSMCTQGDKALCCLPRKKETVDPLKQCKWFGTAPQCKDGFCNDPAYPVQVTTGRGLGGNGQYCLGKAKVFCCPASNTYINCEWTGWGSNCFSNSCPSGKVPITTDSEGDRGQCWIGSQRTYCCDAPKGPTPEVPVSQNGHWGALEDQGCKGDGYRQWSSKLLDISGSWEEACSNHPGWIKDTYFLKPTSCDKSTFGIWGKFWVLDDKCCSKSTKRGIRPEHPGIGAHSFMPRAPPAQCSSSVSVRPNPVNPPNALIALNVYHLMSSPLVRQVLQEIWDFAFVTPTSASETGAFFFQHRTQTSHILIYTGALARGGGALHDQRYPDPNLRIAFNMAAPGQIAGDYLSYPYNQNQIYGQLSDYVLIATAHTHPFLYNLGYGLDPRPSEPDYIAGMRYGIPMIIVTRQGTYFAGPESRRTRSGPNSPTLTEELSAGNPLFETAFWIIPQNQIAAYDVNAFTPFVGNYAFTPVRNQNQLDEPRNGVPLIPPGLVLQAPNPNQNHNQIGPGPGP